MVSGYILLRDAIDTSGAFDKVILPLFFATLAAHAMTLGLNAMRLTHSLSLHGSTSVFRRFHQLIDAMVLHNFLVSFLPARMADGYYPFLIARRAGISTGAGLGNLIVIRLFDVMAIALIIIALSPLVLAGGDLQYLYSILAPTVIALLVAVVWTKDLLTLVLSITQSSLHRFRLGRKISRSLNQARHWTARLTLRQRLELGLFSLVPWMASGFTYIFAIQAIGVDLDWAASMLAGKLAEIGAALPVQAAGGIGAGEGMMAAMMTGYGLTLAAAGLAALGVRFLILGVVACIFTLRCIALLLFADRHGQAVLSRIFGPDQV